MQIRYQPPDFAASPLAEASDARFAPAPADGVLPEGYFSTTNLPTWVRVDGRWSLPERPRMDAAIVRLPAGGLEAREGRLVRAGEEVALGMSEDGSEGILVHGNGFREEEDGGGEEFQFMTSEVSREKPVDYEAMAAALLHERAAGGHVVWVLGPAVLHSRGRDAVAWFVHNGFVGALLGGNAIAVHDVEQALMGTTLGMDRRGRPTRGGHAFHMRAINKVRAAGSLAAAVESGLLTEGIMHACVTRGVPMVLCGSIRDDGPLPEVIQDVGRAQAEMREHAVRATMVVMIATALHSIAFGNMLPSYHLSAGGELRPLVTIAVDSSEFLVSKLKDRGTHQAFGVITNAQDFLHVLRDHVQRAAAAPATTVGAA
jgi:lysine-ketoglutarate reductase/saccharopine dehydrogenase-like protein (TIGR00300 family)